MMDIIRQLRVVGRRSTRPIEARGWTRPARRRAVCELTGWEPLEQRELMSTTQNFEGTGGTTYTLQQVAGPPPPQVLGGGPTGNFLRLATTPNSPVVGNDNSISFVTSDPGTFDEAVANWDF